MNVRGVDLELHPSPDYVSDVIRETGDFYEIGILEEVERRLRDRSPGVLIDVGAMIGNHTAYFARFVPHTHIYAFEPNPTNLDLLRANVDPSVTIMPLALSDRHGTVSMAMAQDNRGWSTITETAPNLVDGMTRFTANARPLDSFGLEDVRLLKIDVEHHEPQVLRGAQDTIARCHPLIVIEDWPDQGYDLPGYRLVAEWKLQHQTFMYGFSS